MMCAVLVWGCKGQAQTGSLNEGEAQTGSPTEGQAQTGSPTKGEAQTGSLTTEHAETMAGAGRDGEAGAGFSGMEDTWAGYSDDQLLDMAQAYYLQKEGSRPKVRTCLIPTAGCTYGFTTWLTRGREARAEPPGVITM